MVSRIEVIPSEVRGYGNIVGAKSLEDFIPVESELSYSEDVYTLTALEGIFISLTASSTSINVGSNLTLSATVMDDDTPVSGVSVSFYDGTTSLGTGTTNSSGVATYTTSSLSAGSHSLSAVYDEKTSNSVSVSVNKLASTISLTVPASGTVGTAYTVTGTLVPSTGSVKLYENGSLKDTLTVTGGAFSKSITQSNEGTYSYYAVFEGSSTYEGSTSSIQSITVEVIPVPSYNGVSLTSDKSILSKADSESATLTAQLLDGSSPVSVSGVTVEFFNGSASLGTATTNSSGVATKTYASAGSGDVSFTAEVGSLVSESYVVEDCYVYDNSISDKHSNWTTSSGVTITHDTGYYIITTTGQDKLVSFANNLDNVRFELVIKAPNNNNDAGIHIGTSPTSYGTAVQMYYNTNFGIVYRTNGSWSAGTRQQSPIPVKTDWNRFILEMNGNNFHAICQTEEDTPTVIFNHSNTKSGISTKYYNMCIGSAQTCHLKEIKIKPL